MHFPVMPPVPTNMASSVLIAMSGGVDSSVAAFLLKESGFTCIGATMRLFDLENTDVARETVCCSLEDVENARSVAMTLRIPYYVFDFRTDFKKRVIDNFVATYLQGSTPNPCIDCNRYLKFEKFYRRSREIGCDAIATGHYARIERVNNRFLLKKAVDSDKDQSYVLYTMTQEQLAHTFFPLGNLRKSETRRIAKKQGFINAGKRESQDICFVPDGNYAKVIEKEAPGQVPTGCFVDLQGNPLGHHRGIIHYTVGQRRGIGFASSLPLYVVALNAKENTVTIGREADLLQKEVYATNFNWISCASPEKALRAKAKIRYRQEEQWATIFPDGESRVRILFDEPQKAVARGQAVVIYDGDIVVGGGTIAQT